MSVSDRQAALLARMGIDRWVPRQAVAVEDPVEIHEYDAAAEPVAVPEAPPSVHAQYDWDSLAAAVKDCTQCRLCETRTQTVLGVGNRKAELMVIGEAPGADEDRQGEPFVGRAGQLLNQMLRAIGMPRETVYIANIVKCRPPNNRDPQPDEVLACSDYLAAQVRLIQPRLILCLGRVAAQRLLDTEMPLGKMRGQRHQPPGFSTPAMVTYHPAYLLRKPQDKAKAWQDLKFARAYLSA